MDKPSFKEDDIIKENFADIASEKISLILCNAGNDHSRAWAMKFLQKATRGFGLSEHEPWLKVLRADECCEVILSNCNSSLGKLDLVALSLDSSMSFIKNNPLQFNLLIAGLASHFMSQIEETQKVCSLSQKKFDDISTCHDLKRESVMNHGHIVHSHSESVCEVKTQKKHTRNLSDSGPFKRKANCGPQYLNIDEALDFLKDVWDWVRTGHVKLDSVLLGDILSHLPECIEEVVLAWAKEAMGSSQREMPIGKEINFSTGKGSFLSETVPSDDDVIHSLSVLQESPMFLKAASSSPKLFQKCSSVLNQLLIRASECSYSWSTMLSLVKTFAQETAKGRAEFYPSLVQPVILLLELHPDTLSSSEQREIISSQITSMCISLPPEVILAVLSHFPAWLPLLDHAALL